MMTNVEKTIENKLVAIIQHLDEEYERKGEDEDFYSDENRIIKILPANDGADADIIYMSNYSRVVLRGRYMVGDIYHGH